MISHPRLIKLSTSACSLSRGMSSSTILFKCCLVALWLNKGEINVAPLKC